MATSREREKELMTVPHCITHALTRRGHNLTGMLVPANHRADTGCTRRIRHWTFHLAGLGITIDCRHTHVGRPRG
ncbi:hypothetical protein ACFC1B_28510, partial [Streptomyces xiamenensis]|uniref:hypothetical protein n=1 Tax=Streptomyces xiamenensis TaxID=408015 RepID=UPI0035E0489D